MGTREERLLKHADRMFDAIMALSGSVEHVDFEHAVSNAITAGRCYEEAMSDQTAEETDLPPRTESNWIFTCTGQKFWPLNPLADGLDIRDIAHSLSNLCRFTGHSRHYFSVAQHSYLASTWCQPEIARWCLLHDAAEAYLGDVASPVKPYYALLRGAELRTLQLLSERFDLPWPMPAAVHDVDMRMLATERRDVMIGSGTTWISLERVQPYPDVIEAVHPMSAEAMFLSRFYELFGTDC